MKIKKITTILLIAILIIATLIPQVQAINPDDFKPGDLTADDTSKPFMFAGTILNAIIAVGVVIAITMVMVLGIRYMLGSVEEKAEYKKTMLPMLLGAIMLFTSCTVVGIIYGVMENLK